MRIQIATGNSRMEKRWNNVEMELDEFIERISHTIRTAETVEQYMKMTKAKQDAIKDVGGFVGGRLKGGRRKKDCVEFRIIITLDIDHAVPGVIEQIEICSKESNAMKSDNPHSGFYEAETSRTLDANGGNPSCNQGGIAVVAVQGSMIGRDDRNGPQGSGVNEDVSFTLNATDHHAVAYPTYCTSKNSYFMRAEKELANTLVATDYKDPPVINDVRTASGKAYLGGDLEGKLVDAYKILEAEASGES